MIKFRNENNLLLLEYDSMSDNRWIFELFDNEEQLTLKKTFTFSQENLHSIDQTNSLKPDYEEPVEFVLGTLEGNYYKISKERLTITYSVFIHINVRLTSKFFTGEKNTSFLRKIDSLVNEDIYIGGDNVNALLESDYNRIVKAFPNNYELQKYVNARVSVVLKDYFNTAIDAERAYNNYMNKKTSQKGDNLLDMFLDNEFFKFSEILKKLEIMLKNEDTYNEKQWQDEILQIILLLYPKYILAFKEAPVKDTYYDTMRSVDYMLIDSSRNIDIVEIKRPFDNCIVSKNQYRDNHIPLRELSGTIMQIEKYIFNLNRWGKRGEDSLTKKYKDQLPEGFEVKITNPNGIIIMGREDKLNNVQKKDFEVIKRKYKNIVDIITYDDLLTRLKFTIEQLKPSIGDT